MTYHWSIGPKGLDYNSGVWQFEGYGFVPNGTSGATMAQIHGAAHGATTLILRIYNYGEMRYYSRDLVAENLYDKWFRLNIIHDVDGGTVSIFIDGKKKFHTWNQDEERSKFIDYNNFVHSIIIHCY
ncbi:citrate-binding protein-like isoform X2 [Arachis stenosperma]|uniref:citrate-binding protein-like isoform X2 n=1 Tax=Arachis stenosperma TaxID=217475 RepID=UPI0025ABDE74|nr:citrate-binding protein-like isoform X2 [Arachis stenosperma]